MHDTTPQARERYYQLLRQVEPQKRLEICLSLSRATRELAIAGIKRTHEGRSLSEVELRQAVAERLYGVEIAQRIFGGR